MISFYWHSSHGWNNLILFRSYLIIFQNNLENKLISVAFGACPRLVLEGWRVVSEALGHDGRGRKNSQRENYQLDEHCQTHLVATCILIVLAEAFRLISVDQRRF